MTAGVPHLPRAGRARSVDPAEIARFDRLARDWWDPNGPMRPLHRLNPARLAFIRDSACRHFGRETPFSAYPRASGDRASPAPLDGLRVLDVGCGGGVLAEPLARLGARVMGLDPAAANVRVARAHAERSGLAIDYREEPVEAVAARSETFDIVLAMEVVEHVADVAGFVGACAACVAPGGLLAMATINRTLKSFALAIVGAEYVLRWLPRGTHDWDKFLRPDELGRAIEARGLHIVSRQGVVFDQLARAWRLAADTDVNYMLLATRG